MKLKEGIPPALLLTTILLAGSALVFTWLAVVFDLYGTPKHYVEKYYQNKYCNTTEVRLTDYSRVDCIDSVYATEVDFDNKWAEAVGQSLWYAYMTKLKPKIIVIKRNPRFNRNINRLRILCKKYNITLQIVQSEDSN